MGSANQIKLRQSKGDDTQTQAKAKRDKTQNDTKVFGFGFTHQCPRPSFWAEYVFGRHDCCRFLTRGLSYLEAVPAGEQR